MQNAHLNKRADGLTGDMFAAIRFTDNCEASEWLLNSIYAPKNVEDYNYVPVEIFIKPIESIVANDEPNPN